MKAKLINIWYDLYDMRCVGIDNYAKKRHNIYRVESILWERYKYDIALTHSTF